MFAVKNSMYYISMQEAMCVSQLKCVHVVDMISYQM